MVLFIFCSFAYKSKNMQLITLCTTFRIVWRKLGVNGVNPRHRNSRNPHKHWALGYYLSKDFFVGISEVFILYPSITSYILPFIGLFFKRFFISYYKLL